MYKLVYIIIYIISFRFFFDPCYEYIEGRIEEASPILIFNQHPENIKISCYEKRIEVSPPQLIPVINQNLHSGVQLYVDYGKSLFEEMLFCKFETSIRKWNCAAELLIEKCVWENPQSIMMRGSLHTDDECPQCDQRNSHGIISCEWALLEDGLYLKEYSPNLGTSYYFPKVSWIDQDPEWKILAAQENLYQFSIRNDIDSVVRITCSNMLHFPINLRARSDGDSPAVWHKNLDIFDDINLVDTWICDLLVVATGMHRNGVRIWTNPGEIHPVLQDPPCIDCAWKLTDENISLDMRGCTYDWAIWEHMYHWIQDNENG